jgi:Ca2+/Na+ antiporter
MVKQDKNSQMTDREKKLYLLGAIIFGGLLFNTLIFGSWVSPLLLLQLRLIILGTGLTFYLAIYFYYVSSTKKKQKLEEANKKYEIIIWFNGRELGRL